MERFDCKIYLPTKTIRVSTGIVNNHCELYPKLTLNYIEAK